MTSKERCLETLRDLQKNAKKYQEIRKGRAQILSVAMESLDKYLEPAINEGLLIKKNTTETTLVNNKADIYDHTISYKDPEFYSLTLQGRYSRNIGSFIGTEAEIKISYRYLQANYRYKDKQWTLYQNTYRQEGEFGEEQFLTLLCDFMNRFKDVPEQY